MPSCSLKHLSGVSSRLFAEIGKDSDLLKYTHFVGVYKCFWGESCCKQRTRAGCIRSQHHRGHFAHSGICDCLSPKLREPSYFAEANVMFLWFVLRGWAATGLIIALAWLLRDTGAATRAAMLEEG